jgi:hypothetical protein
MEQLKRAKTIVLKTHPDKSRLPPEYFIFYKKAFEIIVDFYNNQQKIHKTVPTTETLYEPISTNTLSMSKTNERKIKNNIETMDSQHFHKKFNELFEQNNMGRQIINRNEWFHTEDQIFKNIPETKNTASLHSNFEKIKEQQQQQGMVLYKGVQEIKTSGNLQSGYLYDDIEDEMDGMDTTYIETDPFSKLKFEDLKKVHKNETVFSVSEKNMDNMKIFKNVEECAKSRNGEIFVSFDERHSTRILKEKEEEIRTKMLQKEYESKKKQLEFENKNKSIMSYFLQLK